MGMAASQARFLSLTARKSNVEYEGQQVNQERTALANESANLYNQLNSIDVPTPPSTSDYYTTTYTFSSSDLESSSTTEYTLNNIYTTADGTYASVSYTSYAWQSAIEGSYSGSVNKTTDDSGNSTYSVNLANGSTYDATKYTYQPGSVNIDLGDLTGDVDLGGVSFSLDETGSTISNADGSYSYSVTQNSDGTYSLTLAVEETTTDDSYTVSVAGQTYNVTQNSDGTYSCDGLSVSYTSGGTTISVTPEVSGSYADSDGNKIAAASYLDSSFTSNSGLSNQPILAYTVSGQTYFVSAEEFANGEFSSSTYIANVGTTQYTDYPCTYTTASSGRYQTISITTDNGNTYTYSLNVQTVQDEEAYDQAMLDYEYEQYEYEKKISDINAKTEAIQQQDKVLELRLKQLDTEQDALSTEMEAVEKVIEDNIEATFNTFA